MIIEIQSQHNSIYIDSFYFNSNHSNTFMNNKIRKYVNTNFN